MANNNQNPRFFLGATQPFLLYVNSANRNNPNAPSTLFSVQLGLTPLHISRITLLSACIPNTLFAFRNDQFVTNNNFDFVDSTGTKTAVITPGTYNSASFITELTTQMNAISSDTYTITYNPTTLRFTITSTSAAFQILGATGPNIKTNALYLIGYSVGVNTTPGAVQVAPNPSNIQGPKTLFIKIGNFQTQIHSTNNTFTSLFQINLTSSFGEIEYYEQFNRHETGINVEQRTLNQLDIELVDEAGKLVLLSTDWGMLLRFD